MRTATLSGHATGLGRAKLQLVICELRVESAARVGLIPKELKGKVVVAGNSSGSGAIGACLSREGLAACLEAKGRCTYLELSSRPDFSEAYVEHMFFPEEG